LFELIERGGTYGILLSLWFALNPKSAFSRYYPIHKLFTGLASTALTGRAQKPVSKSDIKQKVIVQKMIANQTLASMAVN
jgi:hypothetical protein